MTNKQRIVRMIEKWPDDIPFEKALYHMGVLKAIVEALQEGEKDAGIEHEEFFRQLTSDEEGNHGFPLEHQGIKGR